MPRLIQIQGNWADEMDTYGFIAMTDGVFERTVEEINVLLKDVEFPLTIGIGTNQDIEYKNKEEYLGDILDQRPNISQEEFEFLRRMFGDDQRSEIVRWGETSGVLDVDFIRENLDIFEDE
jgi:hypothetical protein